MILLVICHTIPSNPGHAQRTMNSNRISLVLLLSVSMIAHASEFHVALNGSDANPGTRKAPLRTLQRAADLDFDALGPVTSVGVTAGASAPEVLVDEIVDAFRARFDVTIETVTTSPENVTFPAPRELRTRAP